jgi:hypothetical protein
MEIGVPVLIGGSFHTPHVIRKEDLAKIAGEYLVADLSGTMKEKAIPRTNNAIAQ